MLEALELARRTQQAAPVAEQHDDDEQRDPAHATPEMHVLHERPSGDQDGEAGEIEDEPGREQEEEAERIRPVQRPFRPREARDVLDHDE